MPAVFTRDPQDYELLIDLPNGDVANVTVLITTNLGVDEEFSVPNGGVLLRRRNVANETVELIALDRATFNADFDPA